MSNWLFRRRAARDRLRMVDSFKFGLPITCSYPSWGNHDRYVSQHKQEGMSVCESPGQRAVTLPNLSHRLAHLSALTADHAERSLGRQLYSVSSSIGRRNSLAS